VGAGVDVDVYSALEEPLGELKGTALREQAIHL
jgi:hypothetical protein